jgi:hypothetical protein
LFVLSLNESEFRLRSLLAEDECADLVARLAKERNDAVGRLHPGTHDFNKAINDPHHHRRIPRAPCL